MHALRRNTPMAALAAAALLLTISGPAPAGAAIPVPAGPAQARGAAPGLAGTQQAISVSPTGPVRTVTPTLLGLNGVNVTGPRWDDSKLDAVLATFGPGMLRYPGGTNANYWDWQSGWFQPGRWPAEPPGAPINDKIGVFKTGLGAAGAAPVFVLNVLTYQGAVGSDSTNNAMLRGQLRFLHAAAAAGLPVTMVELGNELYLTGAVSGGTHGLDYQTRFPAAADYATQMNTWIAALHKAFPGVQVAPVAADPNYISGVSARRQNWDEQVLPPLKGEDVMSVHEIQRVKQTGPVSTVLAQPYLRYQTFAADQLPLFTARNLPLWITAFNMEDQTAGQTLQGSWLHGLYVAEQALLYLANPEFKYISLSGSIGTAHGGAIFDGTDGLGAGKPATVPLALTAAGTTLAQIQSVFHGATQSQALAFSPVRTLGSTGAPALLGEDVTTPSGHQLIVVNAGSEPATLSLATLFPSGFTAAQTTAASVRTLVTGPTSTTTSTAQGTGNVTIGPYTLATISG